MGFQEDMDKVKTELVAISSGAIDRNVTAIKDAVAQTNSQDGVSADKAAQAVSKLVLGAIQDMAAVYAQTLKAGEALTALGNKPD